jgi:hypothetical protein
MPHIFSMKETSTMEYSELIAARHSVRAYRPDPELLYATFKLECVKIK